MDFDLDEEQRAVVETTAAFVRNELVPHEEEVERTGRLDHDVAKALRDKAIRAGLYAANMPEEIGGGGLDTLTWMLMERELGHTGYALQMFAVARPSRILLACEGAQREDYLLPTVRGERAECLAMTEPEAGSDLRGMRTRAVREGGPGSDWIITGTKHFISHADAADYVVLFAATGEDGPADDRPRRAQITAFLVDLDTPGLQVLPGYRSVSHRGYDNFVLAFDGARVPDSAVLGEVGQGFDVANTWLGTTRLQVAAVSLGRARRALDLAVQHAATRRQFGTTIGRNQGVSFQLADMATAVEAASLLTWRAAALVDAGRQDDAAIAMAKLAATETLAKVADAALQIHGGMGLMDELPLERIWRDARVERIWDGTSEIQRHIISRSLLRARGG
ncbi:alkylation response protein AidB-like acyl-CoA dehydrogenase [Kineosphaera limosa]|uniref:Acyl-CoA dehydrogenase n=1 Tax=Kineosphaera limosa NBRC 100340 TaxID=1184609 RepID=K6WUV7_9MICO|nr:acyl-CoA dehydrogenase family protein [Kineosphaera limosa]NYD99766.1 alkylation response protein AidB-like acyl-CoA dehydrogenase [Kineosphaera limosa]GAB95867.1 acyl-CoA dehydrogenase [Kineosphaera limosa NBRC 100340]